MANFIKKGIVKKCLICDKEFYVALSREKAKFCSNACRNESQRTQITLKCVVCKKEYKRHISQVKWRGSSVCSYECRNIHFSLSKSGENSPSWKGGLSNPLRRLRNSSRFKKWRELVFKRDNKTCQDCGSVNTILHPHHIKPFSIFPELQFEISNGRTLCKECHKKADELNRKKFKFKTAKKENTKGARKRGNRWESYITVNKKYKHLGTFDTEEEAQSHYLKFKRKLNS